MLNSTNLNKFNSEEGKKEKMNKGESEQTKLGKDNVGKEKH